MVTESFLIRWRTLFETIVIVALQMILAIVISLAVVELGVLLYHGASALMAATGGSNRITDVEDLQSALQRAFAGVLLVLLGLELLETLKNYFTAHHLRLQVILIVAIIAVSRHIMLLDFEHTDGIVLVGVAVLILSLTVGYFLIGRSSHTAEDSESSSRE
jgi:uncharacterized membrane protein (DUF373 family)